MMEKFKQNWMNNTAVNLLIYKENVFFKLAFDMPPHPNDRIELFQLVYGKIRCIKIRW